MELLFTGKPPQRAYPDDAGLDLTVVGHWYVPPRGQMDLPLGVAIKSPPGHWTMMTGRSSAIRRGLHVPVSVIDPGYIGPLFAVVFNLTDEAIAVNDGERICQLIVLRNSTEQVTLQAVDELPPTPRGQNGFGSTGA
jgi:dUTP pyrophosphatase